MQAGTPVLTMNFPEYAALNRQHEVAILLDRLDPESVSQAIRSLLDDPQRYARLCAACELARKEWVWEREAEALCGIFPLDLERGQQCALVCATVARLVIVGALFLPPKADLRRWTLFFC